jgi:very-short-patch-repair endonuclease
MDENLGGDPAGDVAVEPVTIDAQVNGFLNYASWQNSVPLLQSLTVRNPTKHVLHDLRLTVESSPQFLRPKSWVIDRLTAHSELPIRDRDLSLDADYLNGLNEAERGVLKFTLQHGSETIATCDHDLRVLARDEWPGMNSGGELLAAFVMPNDPAIANILKVAGDVLTGHGHRSALDGYQSGDPGRAYLLVAALWSAVAAKSLTYANPPRSFEAVGQKTRRPTTVLSEGLATCLDSTLLFAAAIEAVGLNPVVVMVQGHCFVGAWLVEKTLPQIIERDCSEIRKAIDGRELVTFETTLITSRPPALFEDAVRTAREQTKLARESGFIAAIDIERSRMAQIRPLASHVSADEKADTLQSQVSGPLPLPALPALGQAAPETSEEKPSTPEGRIDRWQRKLLDLSLRNRLLNFKSTKQSVPILCPDLARLEDLLAAGTALRLISIAEHNPIGQRDVETHRARTHQDLDVEFARQALERKEVACPLASQELGNRLTTIFRAVKNDLSEGGSNTLFLAVGFLRWKPKPNEANTYLAPLLLVPVKLTRKSALSPFHLSLHEDEIRFNATLIQLLKKDFDRDLSALEADLPADETGVDVAQVMDRVRREVRDIPGFEVVDETALGTFSFAKYLMWKDLVDRSQQLKNNRVVRHLIDSPDQAFEVAGGGGIPNAQKIDLEFAPQELYHPLPADSSQLAAVMAVARGQDFVLVGPPGTGKSQTIANMISQCLAGGKTVLFVAEKTAALDVVHRRLREHGLGDCCVELHSNKAERRRFLAQLDNAWQSCPGSSEQEWLTISERLKIRRDELNRYVSAMHREHPNGWSAFYAMGLCVRGGELPTAQLPWANSVKHDRAAFARLNDLVQRLALTYAAVDRNVSLPLVNHASWSISWEQSLLTQCSRLRSATTSFVDALEPFARALGLGTRRDASLSELESLRDLARALLHSSGEDVQLLFHKQFAKFPAAKAELVRLIETHRAAVALLQADYGESLESLPLADLDLAWRKAVSAFFLVGWFQKRQVRRWLQTYAVAGTANPAADLEAIGKIRQVRAAMAESVLANQTRYWNGAATDTLKLESQLTQATELRRCLVAAGKVFNVTQEISKAIYPSIKGGNPNNPLFAAAAKYLKAADDYLAAAQAFADVAGASPVHTDAPQICQVTLAAVDQIETHRGSLQKWTAWCEVRTATETAGLGEFVAALQEDRIAPSDLPGRFQLAYARWWIVGVIDADDCLRTFQRFKHEDAIEDFRRLDDQARSLAAAQAMRAVAHGLPRSGFPKRSELGLLRHQIGLTRPSKTIREVISDMPGTFSKLAPCLLMSPLSISQYLPAEQALFDVVIFDEASQITTWDAVGAIARGKQTIIVGDPKQLPPTNFFGRIDDDEDNPEIEDFEKDLESILDEAQASGLPTLQLNWHYRSRHESLIAFSNWNYYGNKLVTFPAAEAEDRGVSLVHLPDATYDRGKSRTNVAEARAIVADAVARMKRNLALPEDKRLTFGVITFNSQQQSLIQDLLDQAQRDEPQLDWYFSDDRIEPTVVKNLENVQGDERDVMFFSITFGRDVPGKKIPLTFGALNREGGERRLNVAVTRARQELVVYASFTGDQLDAQRSKSRGVNDLKAFLEYAEKGPEAIAARTKGSVGGYDSPLEQAVSEALASKGWQVVPQVGVSGFRVDLGIRHPDKPGAYLAGVECDGATYHRSAVARDRDKTRQMVLENLGWNILRVWSPDWWYDAPSAAAALDAQLSELLTRSRVPGA